MIFSLKKDKTVPIFKLHIQHYFSFIAVVCFIGGQDRCPRRNHSCVSSTPRLCRVFICADSIPRCTSEWPCKASVVQVTNMSHKNMLIDGRFPHNIYTDVNEHGILTASLLKCYEEYYLGKELINRNTCSLFLLCGINGLSYYSVIRMLYKSEKRMILHVIQ
jgi:hypothetical protein